MPNGQYIHSVSGRFLRAKNACENVFYQSYSKWDTQEGELYGNKKSENAGKNFGISLEADASRKSTGSVSVPAAVFDAAGLSDCAGRNSKGVLSLL